MAPPDRLTLGASAAAALWALAVAAYAAGFYAVETPPLGRLAALLFILTALAPAGLLAVAVALLRRAETAAATQAQAAPTPPPSTSTPPAELRALAARIAGLETQIAGLRRALEATAAAPPSPAPLPPATPSPAPPSPAPQPRRAAPADEPSLPFAEMPPGDGPRSPSWDDLARALDFPRDDRDAAGFAALQAAVRDPEAARLLQAAEDMLTMLAADGLHMEDLAPVPASLDAWAAYAEGARGAAAAAIGGVRDEAALALVQARLKRDAIFRDAALVFARRWGPFIQRVFRETGRDPLLLRIADTRSARAFMLVARAMGAFD
ncbi:MAG: hypothetical protein ACFCUS_01595 [Rubrimonas sp.]